MRILNIILKLFRDSLLKNSIYLVATSFVTSFFGFLFWIIAARYYTPTDIGMISAIISSVALIATISSMGLSRSLIFYLPRKKETDKIISSSLTTGIISSIIFSLVFVAGLRVWSPELIFFFKSLANIIIFVVITATISISGLIGATFSAGRKSSFYMVKEIIYQFIKIPPLFLFVSYGAMGILISIGIGLILSIFIGFILLFEVWKYVPKLTVDPIIKKMTSFSAGNYIADIFYNLPRSVLPIIILNMISAKSAGYFYIAITVAGLLYAISQSTSTSFLVESSDYNEFWNNMNKTIKFNMMMLIPGLLLFIIFGKLILNIFNPSYSENAINTMIILTVASIPLSLVNIFNTVRNAQNRITSMIGMNILIALITIVLSIFFIRIMDIEGAAISYLIANLVGALIVINRIKNPKEFTLKLLKDIKNTVWS